MNPVLLKPQSETGAQVVVQGRVLTQLQRARLSRAEAAAAAARAGELRAAAARAPTSSWSRGPAARPRSICARATSPTWASRGPPDVPVVLVGDIERGGVIAQLVGTVLLLEPEERALLVGYVVNKFRGDPALFDDAHPDDRGPHRPALAGRGDLAASGRATCPRRTCWAWPSSRRPARARARPIRVAVPRLPRLANFDDLDPLAAEPDVDLRVLEPGQALPGDTDLVLLPGSKATLGDLAALRAEGWDIDIQAHVRRGGWVLGLCGGYQMLGRRDRRSARASKVRPARRPGWACSTSRRCWSRPRCWPLRAWREVALGRARARLRDPHGPHGGPGRWRGRCSAIGAGSGWRGERRRPGDGLLPARPPRRRRLPRRLPGPDPRRGRRCRSAYEARVEARAGRARRPSRALPRSRPAARAGASGPARGPTASATTASSSHQTRQASAHRAVDVGRARPRPGRRPSSASSTCRRHRRAGRPAAGPGRPPSRPRASRRWASGAAARRAAWRSGRADCGAAADEAQEQRR